MKKLLLIALLIVGCEEAGITSNGLSDGIAVTDTLYIINYDTLIVNNYDTLIVNQFCGGGATIDDCGICTGGNSNLEFNYLMDCNNICGGDNLADNCGTCDNDSTNDCSADCNGVFGGTDVLDNCGTCDSDSTNDCLGDPWMLTSINTKYVYTVAQPAGYSNGFSWPADSSYGIKVRWNYAHYLPVHYYYTTDKWIIKVQHGDTTLYTQSMYDLAKLQASNIGLIAVFENSNSIVNDKTFKMKGIYPGIFYNYSECATAVSTAPMTDQGLYSRNLLNIYDNFSIKRDPSIVGSQVLPPFNDGSITVNDSILNIKFLDRSSHSTRYSEIMDSWNEGLHPGEGNEINSGGDRTYMAFPQMILDEDGAFLGAYDGSPGTTPALEGYYKNPYFSHWGGYYTYYAFMYSAESGLLKSGMVPGVDSDSDGTITDTEVVTYMVANPTNTLTSDPTIKYSDVVTLDSTIGAPIFTDDSVNDYSPVNGAAGGKMTFVVIRDCAVPVDVTIDYNLTFKKCLTNNCIGDGYHINPIWD